MCLFEGLQAVAEMGTDLAFLQTALDSVVDWDGSRAESRIVVQSGLDASLDEYRQVYAQMPEFLGEVSVKELARYPSLHSLAIKYLPQSE